MRQWIYTWLPRICGCHCRPDRSFFWHGRQFPVCARCTGQLLGMVLALPVGLLWGLHPWISVLLMVPMVVDGFVQLLTAYESNNLRRLWTGTLFGCGFFTLCAWFLVLGYHLGYSITSTP